MSKSTSSPEGGGEMTCVDFDVAPHVVAEFRVRERVDARRNALPALLKGGRKTFLLGDAGFDLRFHGEGLDPARAKWIMSEPSLFQAVLALPRGADIRIEAGRCYIAVDGFPKDQQCFDRLLAVSERLLGSLDRRGS